MNHRKYAINLIYYSCLYNGSLRELVNKDNDKVIITHNMKIATHNVIIM